MSGKPGEFMNALLESCQWVAAVGSGDLDDFLFVGIFPTEAEANEAAETASEEYNQTTDRPDVFLSEVIPMVFPMIDWKTQMHARIDKQTRQNES